MTQALIRAALDTALNSVSGIIAASTVSTSSVSATTTITTSAPHMLTTGVQVTISGHTGSTPAVDGTYLTTVIGASTFTIPKAVTIAGSGGTVTANLTAWQNAKFDPVPNVPYQRAYLLFAEPDNRETGRNYTELGFLQVTLQYPQLAGTYASEARAQLIRAAFKRGTSFASGGVTTIITATPFVGDGAVDGDRWATIIKIRFKAEVTA